MGKRERGLPRNSAAGLVNDDAVLCMFSQEGLQEHPLDHQEDQPIYDTHQNFQPILNLK